MSNKNSKSRKRKASDSDTTKEVNQPWWMDRSGKYQFSFHPEARKSMLLQILMCFPRELVLLVLYYCEPLQPTFWRHIYPGVIVSDDCRTCSFQSDWSTYILSPRPVSEGEEIVTFQLTFHHYWRLGIRNYDRPYDVPRTTFYYAGIILHSSGKVSVIDPSATTPDSCAPDHIMDYTSSETQNDCIITIKCHIEEGTVSFIVNGVDAGPVPVPSHMKICDWSKLHWYASLGSGSSLAILS